MLSFLRSKRFIIFLSCFGLVCLLVLSAPTVYRKVKIWRGENLAKDALVLVEKGKISEAWEKVQAAYKLAPLSAIVNRNVATIYDLVDPQRALPFWEVTVDLSQSADDRKKLIQTALKAKNYSQAAQQLEILENEQKTDAIFYFLKAQYLYRENNIEKAFEALNKSLELEDTPQEAELFYAILALNHTSKEIQNQGIEYFKKQGERRDQEGLMALKYLASYPDLAAHDYSWVMKTIEEHPLSTQRDLLLVLSLKERSGLIERSFLLEQAHALIGDSDNLDEKVLLGQWLNQSGYYKETLKQISLEESLKRQDLFLVWLDAMAVEKQWLQLEAVLEEHNIPLEEYLKLLFSSRIQAELGHPSRSLLLWEKMLLLIRDEPPKLRYALDYAFKMNSPPKIRATFKAMIKNNTLMKRAYEQWIYWEKSQGNLEEMMASLRAFGSKFPDDKAVINDISYGELLENKNLKKNLQIAQQLVIQNPSYLSHRITLALALLKNKQPEQALNILRSTNVEWEKLNPSYQAVYVAVLKANDLNNDATAILNNIPLSTLLPQERDLATKEY